MCTFNSRPWKSFFIDYVTVVSVELDFDLI